ncbi:MAG: DNA translocase FtsK 4TM domain-containing protein, partial [Chitinophagales bacterium]
MAEKKKKASKAKEGRLSFLQDERFKKISGVVLVLISFFLLVSFASYLLTWKADQSLIWEHPWRQVFNSSIDIQNHLGNLGAVVSHQFFYRWFGIASFYFVVLFFGAGINIFFHKKVFPMVKLTGQGIPAMLWLSTMLGFLLYNAGFPWGGAFGKGSAFYLESFFGKIGAIALLSVLLVIYLILFTKVEFGFLMQLFRKKETAPAADATEMQTQENAKEDTIVVPPVYTSNEDVAPPPPPPPITVELKKVETPKVQEIIEPEPEADDTIVVAGEEEHKMDHQDSLQLDIEERHEEDVVVEDSNFHFDPVLDLPDYQYPPLELLEEYGSESVSINTEELERNKDQIINTLNNYNIQISKIKATIGPTVTLYEIIPAAGVRISKIKNLEDDIALSLAALGIRIIAPIPGKGTIGIEVPNVNKETVSMRSQIASDKFQHAKMDLPVC